MPKVSVLVPIFNVEQYLEECLDSIVNQTLEDIEIICINDGSTDSSLKIIKKYAKNDPRFVIIDKKNSGYGDSMNMGLKKATGEYIGIVESDDWIEHDMFEQLYKSASENDAEVVKANFYNLYTSPEYKHLDGIIEKVVNHEEVGRIIDTTTQNTIMWQQPSIWSSIYSKRFLDEKEIQFLPSPGASYQDVGFNFKVWATAQRVIFLEDAFLHYRKDNENSSINNPGKTFCVSDEYQDIEKYLRKNGIFKKLKDVMYSTRWGGYRWNIERLSPELAKEFILHASKEYSDALKRGDFAFAYCDVNDSRQLSELISNPKRAIARKVAYTNAKVSIIVPVYNVQSYLERCLNSILNQSLQDIEIIAIDDGSTDGSTDMLEEYFSKDPRLQLLNTHNGGLSFARNNGIKLAHADLIMFCDSDDYYNTDTVRLMYDAITKNKVDIAVGGVQMVYETEKFTAHQKNHDRQYYRPKLQGSHQISDEILKKTDIAAWNKIYRKSIIIENNISFPEGIWYEDNYFFHVYAWSSKQIFFLPYDTFVYNYVRRPDSIMSKTFSKTPKAYDHLEIGFRLFSFLKERGMFQEHRLYYRDILSEFGKLTIQYLPDASFPFALNRLRHFKAKNSEFISKNDPELCKVIDKIDEALSTGVDIEHGNGIKPLVKSYLKKFYHYTPTYRATQHLLAEINTLTQRLDSLEKQQQAVIDALASRKEK